MYCLYTQHCTFSNCSAADCMNDILSFSWPFSSVETKQQWDASKYWKLGSCPPYHISLLECCAISPQSVVTGYCLKWAEQCTLMLKWTTYMYTNGPHTCIKASPHGQSVMHYLQLKSLPLAWEVSSISDIHWSHCEVCCSPAPPLP